MTWFFPIEDNFPFDVARNFPLLPDFELGTRWYMVLVKSIIYYYYNLKLVKGY